MENQYRFENGSLFEYDAESNAYIHCYRRTGCTTMKTAVKEYEEYAEYEEDGQLEKGECNEKI